MKRRQHNNDADTNFDPISIKKYKDKYKDKDKDKDKDKYKYKDKDKVKVQKILNMCYIFEKQRVQGYQI